MTKPVYCQSHQLHPLKWTQYVEDVVNVDVDVLTEHRPTISRDSKRIPPKRIGRVQLNTRQIRRRINHPSSPPNEEEVLAVKMEWVVDPSRLRTEVIHIVDDNISSA